MACYIIATICSKGSLDSYFTALGRELVSRGHRVIILLDGRCYDAVDRESNPSVLTWPSLKPTRWRDARFLHGLIRRYHPSCIVGNFSAVNICLFVGWMHRVPVRVGWSHTLFKAIATDAEIPGWKLALLARRRRFVYKLATHVIGVSGAMAEDLRRTYGVKSEKVFVLPILLPEQSPGPFQVDRNRVVYAGRLSPTKGIDVLLRAIPRIREACPGVVVEFLGDGPLRRELEDKARSLHVHDACRFVGARAQAEVYERMASAAVVVAPSIHDAFPLVTVEASSVGTPVVASDVGGIREIVVDGKTGFLVAPNDPDALAEKIIPLLRDEALRRRLGEAARDHFARTFSNRRIGEHGDFFERLIGER